MTVVTNSEWNELHKKSIPVRKQGGVPLEGNKCHSIILICSLVFLMSCEEEKPKTQRTLIENVKLEGKCFENHVKEPAEYEGSLQHWYNVTEGTHSRYGNVFLIDAFNIPTQPYKYHPPFTIEFDELSAAEISGKTLHLNGISDHVTGRDGEQGPHYEATCVLDVTKRLDHLP